MDTTDADLQHDQLCDYVTGLLDPLGDTADAIAERLTELGITTERGTDACPILEYLQRVHPGIECGIDFLTLELGLPSGLGGSVPMPVPVGWFVYHFARRRYPRLVTQHSIPALPGAAGGAEGRS